MAGLIDLISDTSVRRLIDATYTIRDLPPEVINDETFTAQAIVDLLRLDPDALEHSEDDAKKVHIKNALNRLLAAQILPSIRPVEKEDFGDGGGFTRQKVDIDKRVAELQQQASEAISNVIGVDSETSDEVPPAFIWVH